MKTAVDCLKTLAQYTPLSVLRSGRFRLSIAMVTRLRCQKDLSRSLVEMASSSCRHGLAVVHRFLMGAHVLPLRGQHQPGDGPVTAVPLGRGPSLHGLRREQAPVVRPLLGYYSLVRLLIPRACSSFGITLHEPARPHRAGMRSPRFRTKDVSTCMGSPTARGPSQARHRAWDDVAFS